jgi:phosphotransferase system enzyme I (PtsP)
MLTRLREVVEKVAMATSLTDALELLVNETCLAMNTEVCSIYLADNDRRCYYLMATRGFKKPRGRTITLAFDEGIVGLVGRLAEPINLADAHSHPSFKYVPQKLRRNASVRFSGACYLSSPVTGRAGGGATSTPSV